MTLRFCVATTLEVLLLWCMYVFCAQLSTGNYQHDWLHTLHEFGAYDHKTCESRLMDFMTAAFSDGAGSWSSPSFDSFEEAIAAALIGMLLLLFAFMLWGILNVVLIVLVCWLPPYVRLFHPILMALACILYVVMWFYRVKEFVEGFVDSFHTWTTNENWRAECYVCRVNRNNTSLGCVCKHPICDECEGKLKKRECPLCKRPIGQVFTNQWITFFNWLRYTFFNWLR